jgi:hypothetical protein
MTTHRDIPAEDRVSAPPIPVPPEVQLAIDAAIDEVTRHPPRRADGWTGAKQRGFLEALASGDHVDLAARRVGMTGSGAYAFRSRPQGAAFALAWDAARYMLREGFADHLLRRAVEGYAVEKHHRDGSITYSRDFDNRLAMRLLERMDRVHDRAQQNGGLPWGGQRLRDAAEQWPATLDRIEQSGEPEMGDDFAGAGACKQKTAFDSQLPQLTITDLDDLEELRALQAALSARISALETEEAALEDSEPMAVAGTDDMVRTKDRRAPAPEAGPETPPPPRENAIIAEAWERIMQMSDEEIEAIGAELTADHVADDDHDWDWHQG